MRATLEVQAVFRKREGSANPAPAWKMGVPDWLFSDVMMASWFAETVSNTLPTNIELGSFAPYDSLKLYPKCP